MKSTRVSWQEKLDRVQEWKVADDNPRFPGRMLIPTPRQVDALIREIPKGAVTTPKLMRKTLANRYGADNTCPLCVGIFLRISAEAAEEQRQQGVEDITPYWRVVTEKGKHYPKLPGGADGQGALLESEYSR